jgi:hypothetical protein
MEGVDGVIKLGIDAFLHLLEERLNHEVVDFIQSLDSVYQKITVFYGLLLE